MSEEILAEMTATDAEGDGGLPYVPPLAQFGGERETVPGLFAGLQLVENLQSPYVMDGVAFLPLTPGGGEPSSGCGCVPAYYEKEIGSTLGLIRSVDFEAGLSSACIDDGNMRLPLASSADGCSGIAGGIFSVRYDESVQEPCIDNGLMLLPVPGRGVSGMVSVNGNAVTWEGMAEAPVELAVLFLDGYRLYLTGQVKNGFLEINTKAI